METNYYLVLEKRLGDYNIIDINKLDICDRYYLNNIALLDTFTINNSITDIKESIKRSNLVSSDYLNGNLVIVSDKKHHLNIMTKEIYDVVKEFQRSNEIINKDLKNKLYGAYKKIIDKNFNDIDFKKKMLNRFNDSLKNSNKIEIFKYLEELPYENIRDFYMTIYKELTK